MEFFVPNKKVGCSPLGKLRDIQMVGNAFKTVAQKSTLLELKVLIGNDTYKVGDQVFIKGDCMTLPWTKEEYLMPGSPDVRFILIPEDRIELHFKEKP